MLTIFQLVKYDNHTASCRCKSQMIRLDQDDKVDDRIMDAHPPIPAQAQED